MADVSRSPEQPGIASDNNDVTVDATEGGVTLLEANPKRKAALIQNIGAGAMRVTTDGTAPSTTRGKLISAGGALNLSSPYCPTGVVKAVRFGEVDTVANASEVS